MTELPNQAAMTSTELYIWLEQEPETKKWVPLRYCTPADDDDSETSFDFLISQTREEALEEPWAGAARDHHEENGNPIRLVRFVSAETIAGSLLPPDPY
jgi:hypothetical protein